MIFHNHPSKNWISVDPPRTSTGIGARPAAGRTSPAPAVFGPTSEGETGYARRLLYLLKPDMLVLWDKGFDSNAFLAQVAATGAQILGRLRSNRRTPVLTLFADGSYLTTVGTLQIRVVEAQVTVTCADGTIFTGSYRPATTLTDARRYPAAALVQAPPSAMGTRVGLLRAASHHHAGASAALR
ncbi:hypothetical protein [Microtetraspora glauca]|uniref:Transposase IS4-like domain-containing protein n=1 Tax=Microtetraspora glauca TaxID=1996 RepID=A0ABV3GK53_MICGL